MSGWKSLKKRVDVGKRKKTAHTFHNGLLWNFPSSSVHQQQHQPKKERTRFPFSLLLVSICTCRVSSLGKNHAWEKMSVSLETVTLMCDSWRAWTIRKLKFIHFPETEIDNNAKVDMRVCEEVQIWVSPFEFVERSLNFPKLFHKREGWKSWSENFPQNQSSCKIFSRRFCCFFATCLPFVRRRLRHLKYVCKHETKSDRGIA